MCDLERLSGHPSIHPRKQLHSRGLALRVTVRRAHGAEGSSGLLPKKDVLRVLRALAGIEHITLEDRDAILAALDAFESGLDFADALHVARSSRTSGFATFDRQLARRARDLALLPPVELLV